MTLKTGPDRAPQSIAVIGSGVAGLTAAHVVSRHARVTLFEADSRLGGHAHTHLLDLPTGPLAVDSGFIVHNDRTYPTLLRLFDELDIATLDTDMSMSVSSKLTGLEYAGALGVTGLFPTARNLTRPRYLRMLGEVVRFHRAARRVLDDPGADEPLARFVAREGFSDYFRDNFLLPLVAAVWSCDEQTAADYPARYLFTFLDHHGMLSVFGSPTWRTVAGGSIRYVTAIADALVARGGEIHCGTPVNRVLPTADGVEVTVGDRPAQIFDAVVVATHPHQALSMLAEPTPDQKRILGAIQYLPKLAVLHSDTSLLPRARRAWASWNYQIRDEPTTPSGAGEVAVTYDLTRLMSLPTTAPRMLVTLGRTDLVDPAKVHAAMAYEHPIYTTTSVAAQAELPTIDTDRIAFAGAYHGWGFHEDGAASGVRAAARLGYTWARPEVPA
ncbi:FAD-dependent oxidoreductase [Gordonia westfalica]|uniref:FAD-dependent oxidoreductase n=1 Tax=Gordonia westfalica TaxID=158898 RepID=A0ABU2GVX5_9ACTN|nr:FAD-dependent oxidoreductase [Gordonia westfalica]MDS1115165.1 FAD-dependent oxidoreductase [Gordonia westfalica]